MKNKKIKRIIICVLCLLCLIVLIILGLINFNKEKIVTCTSMDNKIEMEFKKNKLYYVRGTKKVDNFSSEKINNLNIKYDEKENLLTFSLYYSRENEYELSVIGFNYNNSDKYKDVIELFENDNYYCK